MENKKRKKIDNYIIDLNARIGVGAFGEVFKGVEEKTQRQVAIKVLSKKKKEAYITEVKIMKKLKSENIVEFIDVVETSNHYYVVQEYCNGGDLKKRIEQCKRFTEQEVIAFLKDILSGFITLVSNGVIHRDVKPENILINNNKMKIADFGFAKVVLSHSQLNRTLVGTPLYMSPQLLKSQRYTSKCDIWAIGVVSYELIFGKLPWISHSQVELLKTIINNPIKFNQTVPLSNNFKHFLSGCLKPQQAERYSWKQVYTHPLFGGSFKNFIEKHDQQQRKFKQVINNLRVLLHSHGVYLQQIYKQLGLTESTTLTKQVLANIMKRISQAEIIQVFNLVMKKLDEDSSNVVTLQSLNQLLKANDIRTKSQKKKPGQLNQKISQQQKQGNQSDINVLKLTIKKLIQKMKLSGIEIGQLYQSYAKSKSSPLNYQKFQKLFNKINSLLTKQQMMFCFKVFDADQDEIVTFKDFQNTLKEYSK